MRIIIILLVLLLARYGKTLSTVDQLISEYENLSGPTDDVIEKLKQVSHKSQPFTQLLESTTQFLKKGFPIDDSAQNATRQLYSLFKEQFSNRTYRRILYKGDTVLDVMTNYTMEVETQVDEWTVILQKTFQPNSNNITSDWKELTQKCSGSQSPTEKLTWLNLVANIWCNASMDVETRIYAQAHKFFRLLEAQVNRFGRHLQGYNGYVKRKREVIARLTSLNSYDAATHILEELNTELNRPTRIYYDLGYVIDQIEDIIRKVPKNEQICILKWSAERGEFDRNCIMALADRIRVNLIQLQLIAGFCSTITNNNAEQISEMVVAIADKVRDYVPKKQESSWPEVIAELAESSLGNVDLSDSSTYNWTAHAIRDVLNVRRTKNYRHQVLISPNWETLPYFYSICDPAVCIQIKNVKAVNLIITRFEENATKVAERANSWFGTVKENITQIISNNWKTESLPWLLGQIDKHVDSKTFFRTAVFIRNSKLRAVDATVPLGLALDRLTFALEDLPAASSIQFFNPGIWTQNAERFVLYFFL